MLESAAVIPLCSFRIDFQSTKAVAVVGEMALMLELSNRLRKKD